MAGAVELSVDGAPATSDDLAHVALVNYGAYTSFRVEQGGVRGLELHLARLEMRIFYEEMLDRVASVELAGTPSRIKSTFVGGPKNLPIRFRMN